MIRVACALLLSCGAAAAQDVSLRSAGGVEVLRGELLGYDGQFYRVMTEFGEVSVDGTALTCEGACPPADFVPRVRISAESGLAGTLLPPLFETFARRRGFALVTEPVGNGFVVDLSDGAGRLGTFEITFAAPSEGFANLIADDADLVLSPREVARAEAELAEEAGRGDLTASGRSAILALDAVIPIVGPLSDVADIALDDLRAVLRGEIVDWADLGGAPGPIALHLPGDATGLAETIGARIGPAAAVATRHDSPDALVDAVLDDPAALGVTSYAAVGLGEPLALTGPCGARLSVSETAIKTEDFPLTAPVFLYAPARRLPDFARDFVDYATSPAAQSVVSRTGLVDQFPEAIPVAAQGDRLIRAILRPEAELGTLRRLSRAMDGTVRLSLSFRFENGSTELDAQSRSNVMLLAEAVSRGLFGTREIVFAGFSDGGGSAAANRKLSLARATAVRDAVREAATEPPEMAVAAFGEALPMACDDTGWGRRVNRRVEVWLR
ncbi:cell envelope biogenesis protein OmpA [Palleronia sediminis]|uniref:Cell envelope biogenesis protein OmpA n=1 Tax=Palleronia sediminis TaxID=2547833 RepID=A0A4R6A7L2_9RHOB|nr:phosphate ABC transporter substrate-binding/OmpA family protein [Palleronia sediminis]TDL78178.1 cell envelope biogenesis protein OmpA [Palleronia sediminis]